MTICVADYTSTVNSVEAAGASTAAQVQKNRSACDLRLH
jgi:hypothetical protein